MKTVNFKSKPEEKKIRSLLSDEIVYILKKSGAYLAGGAITSLFSNGDINDLDIYFPSEEALVRTIASIFPEDNLLGYDELKSFSLVYNGYSQRTLMFKHYDQEIQFMTFKYFDSPEDIFESFDFTVCMGAYSFADEEFTVHKDFLQHNAQRYLKFNDGTDYPIMSLLRTNKYKDKGYSISKMELIRIIMTCMSLDLKTWYDAVDHIGGMYGYDLSETFDTNKPFSVTEVCNQLDELHENGLTDGWKLKTTDADFESICGIFVTVPSEFEKSLPFKDGHLYKCVWSDWRSPYADSDKKITYKKGDILDTDDVGKLCFHNDPLKPCYDSKQWVEAKLLDGDVVTNNMYGSVEKVAVTGKIEITDTFIYNLTDSDLLITTYLEDKYGVCKPESEAEEKQKTFAFKSGV